jgi:hypothetical protein
MSAKAIGFSFPESMLKEADEIIRKPSDVNSSTIK